MDEQTVSYDFGGGTVTTTSPFFPSFTSASASSDDIIGGFRSGTVTFAPGQEIATVTFTANPDATYETDETVLLTLTGVTGGSPGSKVGEYIPGSAYPDGIAGRTATATIGNDDLPPPTVQLGSVDSSFEGTPPGPGGTGIFHLTRTGNLSAETTVTYNLHGGNATADDVQGGFGTGSVTFAAGQIDATVSVNWVPDNLPEADETVVLTLTGATGGGLGHTTEATATIFDDDNPAVVQVVGGDRTAEGTPPGAGGTGTFHLSRTGNAAIATTVTYALSGGTATADDVQGGFGTGSVTFTAGQRDATVAVSWVPDATPEPDETVLLTLTGVIGGQLGAAVQGQAIIADDDTPPPSTISIAGAIDRSALEGTAPGTGGTLSFQLYRVGDLIDQQTVGYMIGGGSIPSILPGFPGTVSASSDDIIGGFRSGSVIFAPGQDTVTVTITANPDATPEADETFQLTLTGVTGGTPGATLGHIVSVAIPGVTGGFYSQLVGVSDYATIRNDDFTGQDGYIVGATVFADANGNGTLDTGEASATTDATGGFTLTGGSGPLVLTGGTDSFTKLPFGGRLTAPAGSSVVTPLTTLVETLAMTGGAPLSVQDAEKAVLTAFGLTLPQGSTLDSFDPIAGLFGGIAGSAAVYAAATEILDTVTMAGAALAGLNPVDAQADILAALAASIAAHPAAALDLADTAVVDRIVAAAVAMDPALPAAPTQMQLGQIASVIAASNALAQQAETASTPQGVALQLSAVAHVAQDAATTALANFDFLDDAVARFTDTALGQAVQSAAFDISPLCFCRGTMILTPDGERAVETLRIGDRVVTLSGVTRAIRWIGWRHMDLARHPRPARAQPVRILAGAFADGVPARDLRLSPDHAVWLGGDLVPARLLINGGTIRRETACRWVTYYHVELDTHDVLLADGLAAESYLDTGNRGMFANADLPLTLHPDLTNDQNRRVARSCAPFLDDPRQVEPIWRRLAARAAELGHISPEQRTTHDPDLQLQVDGRRIRPVARNGSSYMFALPGCQRVVRLRSRAAAPCDAMPWMTDQRCLGVMVERLTIRTGTEVHAVPVDHPALTDGWWDVEPAYPCLKRWTNGDARLDLLTEGLVMLEIVLAGGLAYPVDAGGSVDGPGASEALAAG